MKKYAVVMGVEIHCELKTKTKCFSNSPNTFGQSANSQTNAIDCGYPGTLPTINQKVVIMALQTCQALQMEIDSLLRFDRKNYFYPDLPKGYQITQFYHPIGRNGQLTVMVDNKPFIVTFERLQIEEDTAKQIHDNNKTLLDYNRAGIPLLEIVTKPVFTTSKEVIAYVSALREILIYLEVSDAKMNEGSLRCDINISLKTPQSKNLGTKVEIKNLNSLHNIACAIDDEIARQTALLHQKIAIIAQTRRFDEKSNRTVAMRNKESNIDYKYFPEPNMLPIQLDPAWIKNIISSLPPLPAQIQPRICKEYGLSANEALLLIAKKELLTMFEATVKINNLPQATFNYLFGAVQAHCNSHNITINDSELTAANLAELITLINDQKINDKQSKTLLTTIMTDSANSPNTLVKTLKLQLISDETTLTQLLTQLLQGKEKMIIEYKTKPEKVLKFFMGQLMKTTKGQAHPQIAQTLLQKLLEDYKID